MVERILVATYTNDIHTLYFDKDSTKPSLDCLASTTIGFHPSWISAHPKDRSLVYACLEQGDGKIVLLHYAQNDKGIVLDEATTRGRSPCCAVAADSELFVANYDSGSVSVIPISTEPPHFAEGISMTQLQGSGPNRDRQEASHAHQVVLLQDHGDLLVPDLGGDRVYIFKKDQSGKWSIHDHVQFPPGSGPRHAAVHDGFLYTLFELTSQLAQSPYPPDKGSSLIIRSTMSNPPPLPHDMLAAEVLIPPPNASYPTAYVYVSNRNNPSPGGDTIAIFSTSMELVAEVPTGLKHVRGILFFAHDDRFLVAGGVHGGGVKVFERIEGGKSLKEVASNPDILKPTGFLWL